MKVLSINPGSTSTKFALYQNEQCLLQETIRHTVQELSLFQRVIDQFEFRKNLILKKLEDFSVELSTICAVVGRGGFLKPLESGVYEVNELMKKDLMDVQNGEHASNLGALLAADIAEKIPNCRAFIVDPIVVDELQPIARISGHPLFPRQSVFHALNHKAVARKYAKKVGKRYEELNLVIAHLGGGISVGAHCKGRVVDVNDGLTGYGPFSPERAGTLPAGELIRSCFSGDYTFDELMSIVIGKGGLFAHLGTNEIREIEARILQGEAKAELILSAMAYQIAKEIGAYVAVLDGKIDAILLTGGIAYSRFVVESIISKISFLAPIEIFAGEDELWALASGAFRVLEGEPYKEYK